MKVYPEFAAAWNLLGETYLRIEDTVSAKQAFREAIRSDSQYIPPYLVLSFLELRDRNYEETVQLSSRALELDTGSAEASFYQGSAYVALGSLNKAEDSLRAVVLSKETGRFPRTYYLLGTILVRRGSLADAALEFRHYLELEPDSRPAQMVRQQLEKWKSEGLIKRSRKQKGTKD